MEFRRSSRTVLLLFFLALHGGGESELLKLKPRLPHLCHTKMNTTTNSNNNATTNNSDKMNTRKIKINFQGASRDVDLPSPFTLAGLQQATASTFGTEMPPRSGADEAAKDSDLSFTYKDPDGDDIVFDKDSELILALRLCPSSLEITAAAKETVRDVSSCRLICV